MNSSENSKAMAVRYFDIFESYPMFGSIGIFYNENK